MTSPDLFPSLQLALQIILLCILCFTVAQNPVNEYAPTVSATCPETSTLVRTFTAQTQALNMSETEYIASREFNVISNAWSSWLGNASDIGYSLDNLQGKFPRIGIAIGGEGYRTAQYGAGVLLGLDWRNNTAREQGTGGLLQVASYLSASSGKCSIELTLAVRFDDVTTGILGGSWLLGSLLMNDWPLLQELVYGNGGGLSSWMLDLDLIVPSSPSVKDSNNELYWSSILASVESKSSNGVYIFSPDFRASAIALTSAIPVLLARLTYGVG